MSDGRVLVTAGWQTTNHTNVPDETTGGLTVTAPANGNAAPPGHYMLFIVDGNGVPSVAPILKVGP